MKTGSEDDMTKLTLSHITTAETRAGASMRAMARALCCAGALALGGCAYYPYPVPAPAAVPANYDRSFSAASGAMRDQGLSISVEDRGSGTIVGSPGAGTVTATISRQGDGSVRVQFDGAGLRDAGLLQQVSRSYDARMGR
ncbi:hypothetical protein WKW79_22075 [Variovorax robiniae]|uniref:Uncharacterized protein n=1 Tax=Variovorax robiniae TaxID=1836199 RepID=A0ABU8XBN5_9BURK